MTNDDRQRWLAALQEGLPLESRPFAVLARTLGCTEAELLDFTRACRAEGIVRRFGAVFDARRLGYRSALCAATVPPEALDDAAARVTPLAGVTHCYARVSAAHAALPNLWFTLSAPADVFPAMTDEMRARLSRYPLLVLPALKRYKVDVVFGASSRAREEVVTDGEPVTAFDRAAIGALQGDTEERADYFAALAERLGTSEWKLLATLEMWRRSGRMKRLGLVLAHRRAGWTANGMCCWRVDGDTTACGRRLAARAEVTHCYERPLTEAFPYNLFAMVHARSLAEAEAQYAALDAGLDGAYASTMLVSTREFKKTSMTFFASPERNPK